MKLYMKIGTHPAQYVDALRLRKPPIVGQLIMVREPTPTMYPQPTEVRIEEIRYLVTDHLYLASR